MSLKERILEFRAKHNLSQEDFANLCQVNIMTINTIETGKRNPTKLTIAKIERVLKKDE